MNHFAGVSRSVVQRRPNDTLQPAALRCWHSVDSALYPIYTTIKALKGRNHFGGNDRPRREHAQCGCETAEITREARMGGNPCHYIHIFYSLAAANVGIWMGLALGGSLAEALGLR